MKKSGFTLVELSIVLVIIGLLIGGILVGQSMVESATINSQIRQFQQFDIAINNFKSKYKAWPGDSKQFSAAGDGDGYLENLLTNSDDTIQTSTAFTGEVANFWRHLQQNGFLAKEYASFSNNASTGIRTKTHIPVAAINKNTGIVPFFSRKNLTTSKHSYYVANFNSSTGTAHDQGSSNMAPSITVAQMAAMDTKIDDGFAQSSDTILYPAGNFISSSTTPSCYIASGTYYQYNMAYTGNCTLFLVMLSRTEGK